MEGKSEKKIRKVFKKKGHTERRNEKNVGNADEEWKKPGGI
jgi:hypothetical protein